MRTASDHPRVPIPPPLVFVGALIIVVGLDRLAAWPLPAPATLRVAGLILLIGGFLLAVSAFSRMGIAGTSPDPRHPDTSLLTNGPYRFTRNPIYLGFTVVFLGATFLVGTLWGIALVPLLMLVVTRLVVLPEEEYLFRRFPEQYQEYSRRVRRWL
jgi:protein-S-isoprenylcysteine O-methyltransferase Ste14